MKVLVTGSSGFVGNHLIPELKKHGHDVICATLNASEGEVECDITDPQSVEGVCLEFKPDSVIHLAGIARTHIAPKDIQDLGRVNIVGTYNLCRALAMLPRTHLVYISSGLVFCGVDSLKPFSESDPPHPPHAYAMSKLAAENIVRTFSYSPEFRVTIARPFNHIGPNQTLDFVVPALAKRIKEASDQGTISVGDLSAYRDFVDVRDIVVAYRLMVERQYSDEMFVLASGEAVQITDILERLIKISGKAIEVEIDQKLLRKRDPQKVCGDSSLARQVLGWAPTISLDQSLRDTYASI